MLRRILRALLVSAAATGAAVLVLRQFDDGPESEPEIDGPDEVDADSLPPDQREALLKELEAQV